MFPIEDVEAIFRKVDADKGKCTIYFPSQELADKAKKLKPCDAEAFVYQETKVKN